MRQVQADFDKQYEITKLLLEGMSTVQVNCQFLTIDLFVFALLVNFLVSYHFKSFKFETINFNFKLS